MTPKLRVKLSATSKYSTRACAARLGLTTFRRYTITSSSRLSSEAQRVTPVLFAASRQACRETYTETDVGGDSRVTSFSYSK